MKVFRQTIDQPDNRPQYLGTLSEAKRLAKTVDKALRKHTTVEEIDVQTDKAGVVAMLNGEAIVKATLREWGLTARGALEGVQ